MYTELLSNNKKTLKDNPEYFGAYLNMARLNIYTINNHLAEKFNFTPLINEELIKDSFLGNKDHEGYAKQQTSIYTQLKRFLPIVKVFDDETLPLSEQKDTSKKGKSPAKEGKNFNKLSDDLSNIFKEIHDFRNDYTHYYSTETKNERKKQVNEKTKAFLNENFVRAIAYTQERFDIFEKEDFNIAINTKIVNDDNTITQDGMIFLISLFLDRENTFLFMNKIVGLKGTQERSFIAKREVLSAYCIQLPHEKFISKNPAQAFSLELINELNKCPKTLYNVITETEKKKFQPQLGIIQRQKIIEVWIYK